MTTRNTPETEMAMALRMATKGTRIYLAPTEAKAIAAAIIAALPKGWCGHDETELIAELRDLQHIAANAFDVSIVRNAIRVKLAALAPPKASHD